MACNFLAIPGASASVERLFLKSRHLCTDLRGPLKVATVTEAMCARQWLHEGLFKLMRMAWGHIYSFSIMVCCILNINGLNGYYLPYPYKYRFCMNETKWLEP